MCLRDTIDKNLIIRAQVKIKTHKERIHHVSRNNNEESVLQELQIRNSDTVSKVVACKVPEQPQWSPSHSSPNSLP